MRSQIEPSRSRPPVLKQAAAGIVLVVIGFFAIHAIISTLLTIVIVIAVIAAVAWAANMLL